MLFMPGVSTKGDPLLAFQTQRLRPKPFSHLLFNPLSDNASVAFSSKPFTAFALFKSKTKAPPTKVKALLVDLFLV